MNDENHSPTTYSDDQPEPAKRRRWVWPAVSGAAFLFGLGIGLTAAEDEMVQDEEAAERIAQLQEDNQSLQRQLQETRDERDDARRDASAIDAERDERIAELEDALSDAEAELEAFEEFAQAAEVAQAEAEAEPTSFGSGVHVVGTDIEAGTYRTDGPGSGQFDICYWARLSGLSGDFDELIANGTPDGPATVEILESDAGFETSGCGQWAKVQ